MRILFCNKYNFPFSGTEVYLFELMELLRAHGHQVALFTMADPRGTSSPYDQHLAPLVNFKGRHGWLDGARLAAHAVYSREARRRLRRMIADFQPDVAHVRNIYHHLSPSVLWELKAQRVPVVYHLNDFKLICPTYNLVAHGHVCEHCSRGSYWRMISGNCYAGGRGAAMVLAAEAYVHRWLRTYAKCVDLFLAPSQFVKDKLVASGWSKARIEVLPHFQKLADDSPPPAEQAPILYFGRLSPEKGVADLLWAMTQVRHIPLQIAGDGPQKESLVKLTGDLQLSNVSFLGHLTGDQLERTLARCQFTVLPSRAYETLGKSILESYAHGRPVIASNLGSRRELVEQGKTGLLFKAGDIEQLAQNLSLLHAHPEVVEEMGTQARELVRTRHSPEAHYRALMELYGSLPTRGKPTQTEATPQPKTSVRVAFIGGRGVISRYSGIEAYYEEVGKRLVEMGHEVTVYCRTYFTPRAVKHNGMRLVHLPTIRSKHLDTLVHTLLSTVHASFGSSQIIHYHALGPSLFSFLPRLAGKKTVVTVQGLDWKRKKWGRLASFVLRLGEHASVQFPNETMVVSQALQEYYQSRYRTETIYIPNGSEVRERQPAAQIRQWGLQGDDYILYLGRFSPEKNCHLLIEAYERIDTPLKLVLAGGSSYSNGYADELRRHRSERVRLLEWVSGQALEELLTNAQLFVLPSDLEGMSLALLDAMGAGVCVLTSNVPENCELVKGAGFTFRHGDVTDLERMLRLLLSDKEIRQAAARCGQQRVREQYLWSAIATRIESVYLEMLGCRSSDSTLPVPKRPPQPAEAGKHRVA